MSRLGLLGPQQLGGRRCPMPTPRVLLATGAEVKGARFGRLLLPSREQA